MSAGVPVRVRVQDSWEEVELDLDVGATVADLKRRALTEARRPGDPAGYEVKFRGATLLDESALLERVGVVANAELIVLPRRRQPVR